jgi:hypothetical protein
VPTSKVATSIQNALWLAPRKGIVDSGSRQTSHTTRHRATVNDRDFWRSPLRVHSQSHPPERSFILLSEEGGIRLVPCQIMILGLNVIPAQAGIQSSMLWIPACAGMTNPCF